jgi:hypothetical protein
MTDRIDPTLFPAVAMTPSGSSSSMHPPQQSTDLTVPGYGAVTPEDKASWYEAMAKAWGQALDKQTDVIVQLADQLTSGEGDLPSVTALLTAESQRLTALSSSAATATNSVGNALETLGRKQ